MFSTPFDNVDVGNWSCTLGMAALFVEALLVAMAAYAISHGHRLLAQPASVSRASRHLAGEDVATRRSAVWN
jgi:hypothetical protein